MPAARVAGSATFLDDVVVAYGDRRALDGLTVDLAEGRVTGLLGPNGAGKTTAVAVLAGLRRAQSGVARVLRGEPGRPAARERVGVMLQSDGLPTAARGVEIVQHVAALRGAPQTAAPLVERLGLTAFGRTPIRRLSGGERRRVSLACALVGDPQLVLLDEPTAGLDPRGRAIVGEIVSELRDRGRTVLLSTHLLDEAESLCDDIAIIARGQCRAQGTLEEIASGEPGVVAFDAPRHLDLATLRAGLPDGCTVREESPGRYRVEGPDDPRTLATVASWCAQHGVSPRNLRAGGHGLQDAFWRLTGEGVSE